MSDIVTHVTPPDGNVFEDLGLDGAPDLWLKSQLMSRLREFMKRQRLTQAEVARQLGISQPAVSAMLSDFSKVSVERLLFALGAVGADLSVAVRPGDDGEFWYIVMEDGQEAARVRKKIIPA
jgi:predicted XRE-type DNA-binding protein